MGIYIEVKTYMHIHKAALRSGAFQKCGGKIYESIFQGSSKKISLLYYRKIQKNEALTTRKKIIANTELQMN